MLNNVMEALDRMEWTDQSRIRIITHMRLQAVTSALQGISCVEMVEVVQVHFTLRLRDQQS